MLSPRKSPGQRPHRITLQNPGPALPNDDGGYTQTWTDLEPAALWASIEPASAERLEKVGAGTVTAQASHLVAIPYHAGVTTHTRVLFNGRVLNVVGMHNTDERNVELVLVCEETKP